MSLKNKLLSYLQILSVSLQNQIEMCHLLGFCVARELFLHRFFSILIESWQLDIGIENLCYRIKVLPSINILWYWMKNWKYFLTYHHPLFQNQYFHTSLCSLTFFSSYMLVYQLFFPCFSRMILDLSVMMAFEPISLFFLFLDTFVVFSKFNWIDIQILSSPC